MGKLCWDGWVCLESPIESGREGLELWADLLGACEMETWNWDVCGRGKGGTYGI